MMDSFLGMCCINRNKDDLSASDMLSASRPLDFIRSRPGLYRVLKWFDEVDESFRSCMNDVPVDLKTIIAELDDYCDEEFIELNKGHEISTKVVERSAVTDILQLGQHRVNTMQRVLENIDFFKVESASNDQAADQYDFNKLILFCLLFCDEQAPNKVQCLWHLMSEDGQISSRSEKTRTVIAMLTIISCMIPCEIIKAVSLNPPLLLIKFIYESVCVY